MNKDWLDNLKVGDLVIVSYTHDMIFCKVQRITKTMIITERGRYNRQSGWQVGGGSWTTANLVEPTEERIAEIKHKSLHRKLSNFNFKDLPLESLQEIKKIIQEKGFEL